MIPTRRRSPALPPPCVVIKKICITAADPTEFADDTPFMLVAWARPGDVPDCFLQQAVHLMGGSCLLPTGQVLLTGVYMEPLQVEPRHVYQGKHRRHYPRPEHMRRWPTNDLNMRTRSTPPFLACPVRCAR